MDKKSPLKTSPTKVTMDKKSPQKTSPTKVVKTMELNDHKAGMEGLDKDTINAIIQEASQGTAYFKHQEKRQQRIDAKIQALLQHASSLTESDLQLACLKVDAMVAELEWSRDLSQTIVHVDMDMFYAAVEMLDRPELRDVPMAVGTLSMLSTSNYVARKFGVRAAMPGFIGRKLCPQLVLVPHNFEKYKAASRQVQAILREYDPQLNTVSLDEAYLNISQYLEVLRREILSCSDCHQLDGRWRLCSQKHELAAEPLELADLPAAVVDHMRQRIFQATKLTASAGIGPNTLLAKVCSDLNKPNGQFWLQPDLDKIREFVANLHIRKVGGIGPVQGQMLAALGITTCQDLWSQRYRLSLLFSPSASVFYLQTALGLSSTNICSEGGGPKSKSVEETFREISDPSLLVDKCRHLSEELSWDLKQANLMGKLVAIKLKTVQFETHTRNVTLPSPTNDTDVIFQAARQLLEVEIAAAARNLRLRLLGVKVGSFQEAKEDQPTLAAFLQAGSKPRTIECPSCGEPQSAKPSEINAHLDQCLKRLSQESSSAKEASTSYSPGEASSSKQGNFPSCEEILSEDASAIVSPQCEESSPGPSAGLKSATKPGTISCPSCKQTLSHDPSEINSHLDQCLQRLSQESSSAKGASTSDSPGEPSSSKQGNFPSCEKILSEDASLTVSPQCEESSPGSSAGLESATKPGSVSCPSCKETLSPSEINSHLDQCLQRSSQEDIQPGSWTCPICHIAKSFKDLADFNSHIDACLNHQTIKELVREDKRKEAPTAPKDKKKRKYSQHPKIDQYFVSTS